MYTVALQAVQGNLLMPPDLERTPGRLSIAGHVCWRSAAQSSALTPGGLAASIELVTLRRPYGLFSAFTDCTAADQELDGTQETNSARRHHRYGCMREPFHLRELVQKVLDGHCIIADGTALVFPWQTCISMECLYIDSGYYALTAPPAPQMHGKIIGIL